MPNLEECIKFDGVLVEYEILSEAAEIKKWRLQKSHLNGLIFHLIDRLYPNISEFCLVLAFLPVDPFFFLG